MDDCCHPSTVGSGPELPPDELTPESMDESLNSGSCGPWPSIVRSMRLHLAAVWKQSPTHERDAQPSQLPEEEDPATRQPTLSSETTALLHNDASLHIEAARRSGKARVLEEAIMSGSVPTTWQQETKVLARYSIPMIVSFSLQYSLSLASVIAVGHLGKVELGAISLASMTANITGYNIYQGLATSLDTLCPQAYGSGNKRLVGLQLQRMVYFLLLVTIPIAALWIMSTSILRYIVPDPEVADLVGAYLRILLLGMPAYAAFESGKRYVQAQGIFSATVYVLLICAPLNAFMCWLFVWRLQWGFIGAPIALAITNNLLALLLLTYVVLISGHECWPGLTSRALTNWVPMVKLALPGLLMLEAEFLAFEILTLVASYFGTTHLAAQSIIVAAITIPFLVSFPTSIAASTRIATFIGAELPDAAKTSVRVALIAACGIGFVNAILVFCFRSQLPRLFTSDLEVIHLVANILPICAAFQLFDSLAASCNGILRGLGRQGVGGWINLFSYYAIAVPVSLGTGFGLHWKLYGLWVGPALGLCVVTGIEGLVIHWTSIDQTVNEARKRNVDG